VIRVGTQLQADPLDTEPPSYELFLDATAVALVSWHPPSGCYAATLYEYITLPSDCLRALVLFLAWCENERTSKQ